MRFFRSIICILVLIIFTLFAFILNTLVFKINQVPIVNGGYLNTNSNNSNNSILKRVLIILLIVVIIIIIVLIVLFIINKYKNNKSDP